MTDLDNLTRNVRATSRDPHTPGETRRAQLAVAQAALTGARGEAVADCRELLDMLGIGCDAA